MIGWLDCTSGASGDMLLGALAGAGVPHEVFATAAAAVGPEHVEIEFEAAQRAGFAATRARVAAAEPSLRRTWKDIRELLEAAPLDAAVRERSLSTFARLAHAEAAVHGCSPEEVHFHEVGALDTLADVVGACAGFVHLGLSALHASPVALGGGRVETAHGTLAVPPPAVVELLRGIPTYGGPVDVELCTPTGAALLVEWVDAWGPQPALAAARVGVGAGGRDSPGHANVVRLVLGNPHPAFSTQVATESRVLETNVDDLDPRLWPGILTRLLDAGASDAWLTPILMKKGRPAHTLSVLVDSEQLAAVRGVVFQETSTIGAREYDVDKHALQRREETVEVDGHPLRVKLAVYDGEVINAQPEFDDVAAVAAATRRPARSVLADAVALARTLQ